jgi:NAD-dependent DNA ligase
VPLKIAHAPAVLEVRGEVFMTTAGFAASATSSAPRMRSLSPTRAMRRPVR